jgi:hypothetical protein
MLNARLTGSLWLRFSIVNLFIVALIGALMRYKIGFEFPYFNQKNLQHAHSHFAFTGWITHTLFAFMADVIVRNHPLSNPRKYSRLIIANLLCAYGMLISFAAQGYGAVSITFSCASIVTGYIFAALAFKDMNGGRAKPYKKWFAAALWFNIISSLGTFTLGYMMATHNFDQHIHLGALYYYLHFQYNGFFMFACMGLLVDRVGDQIGLRSDRIFWMFFLSCIPAYFLSVLWARIPVWLYVIVVISAVVQLTAWIMLMMGVKRGLPVIEASKRFVYFAFLLIAISMTIKFILQLGSTIPFVSTLAFGFRPIVIAYLHLVLLAIISVFLVCLIYLSEGLGKQMVAIAGLALFVTGVYLNELVLGVQGVASFSYTVIPYAAQMLFAIAVLIVIAVALLIISQRHIDMPPSQSKDGRMEADPSARIS